MTFRESMSFVYDGISSEDMGVVIASPDGGLFQETFLSSRSIVEKKIPGKNKSYFQRVDSEPLSFSFHIFIEEWQERDNLRQIQRWLNQDYYKPLIFSSQTDKMYFAILEGDSEITHNGGREGYIRLNVRCDSSFSYSQELYESNNITGQFHIHNEGDLPVKPYFKFKAGLTGGTITIKNKTNNMVCTIANIRPREEIFIDNENEHIASSMEYLGVYHFDDHNDVWIELETMDNELEIVGDATLTYSFRAQYLS